ncbi:MAG: hypothetical protein COT73_12640, partial [Bdellovibrio sp. CG10_big_fil_rev_8_21_14_0_10_47_8]
CNSYFTNSTTRDHSENTNMIGNALRTGSQATNNCVSRYGLQDMAGNVTEITSDVCDFGGTGNQTC